MQRLLAEAVAREHQPLLARIPQREGEGAAQLLHHLLVPVLVGAQHELGVAPGGKGVSALGKRGAQLGRVHDRAVEGERDAARLVDEAGRHHDGAARLAVDERRDVAVIAMRERLGHGGERVRIGRVGAGGPAGYAAHAIGSS